MKTRFLKIAMLALVSAPLFLTSCSSDEGLSSDENTVGSVAYYDKNGISVELNGGIYDIIAPSGSGWIASVTSGSDWMTADGKDGDSEIVLSVDPLYTGIGRTGTITVSNSKDSYFITVSQMPSVDGVASSNSDVEFIEIAKSKGLGTG